MVPLAVVLMFIMGVFAVAILMVEAHIRDRDIAERTAAVEQIFLQKMDKDTNLMVATMRCGPYGRTRSLTSGQRDR